MMVTSPTPTVSVLPKQSEQVRRVKRGVVVAAAGMVAAYGIRRLLAFRTSETRQYHRQMKEWLATRLERLSQSLDLTADLSARMTKEIQCASRTAMKLASKARHAKPEKGDLFRILLEKRLVGMKARLHNMLDLSEAAHAGALHEFYEELRMWIFGERVTEVHASVPETI